MVVCFMVSNREFTLTLIPLFRQKPTINGSIKPTMFLPCLVVFLVVTLENILKLIIIHLKKLQLCLN